MTLFVVITSVGIIGVNGAGNYHDSHELIPYSGDGCDISTTSRGKWDYTSSYIKVLPTSQCGVLVDVMGNNVQYPLANFYSVLNRCTYGPSKLVGPGQYAYLPNLVKERGFSYCNLAMMTTTHNACLVDILWSPDSI